MICVNAIIEKDSSIENFLDFYKTLRKTSTDYHLCIINNSNDKLKKYDKEDFITVIDNNIDVGFVTACNQGLHFAKSSNFQYALSINTKYSLIANENWLENIFQDFGNQNVLGGTVCPVRITDSEKIKKILYTVSKNDGIKWLEKWVNNHMVTSYVNENIFIINNDFFNKIKLPDSRFCDKDSYGLALSLSCMKSGNELTNIDSIYSLSQDNYRFDIFKIVEKGASILHPVVLDYVRKRFL